MTESSRLITSEEYEAMKMAEEEAKEIIAELEGKLENVIEGDKGTLKSLKELLPSIEFNTTSYEYLEKIIHDMEEDLEKLKCKQ